ncbi:hypothetical protein D3C86_657110 [compost metagenome]
MSQQINDNFQLLAGLSLDDRYKQPTITARDSISITRRYQGLLSFVEQTGTLYMLVGGVENSNWKGIAGADTSNDIETIIEGLYVLTAGKNTPLDWEVSDKFRGWIGNRYVVGTILSLPVSLPSDIDNTSKVELAIDSNALSGVGAVPQTFTALSTGTNQTFTITGGYQAKTVYKSKALLYKTSEWTQSGSTLTIIANTNTGNTIYVEF